MWLHEIFIRSHVFPWCRTPQRIICVDNQMAGGSFCMQAVRVQTSSQPISQEDLQIPLGRAADPTRIAATCLVLKSKRKIDSFFKEENVKFPQCLRIDLGITFLFMCSLNQLPKTNAWWGDRVCPSFSPFNIKKYGTDFLQSLKERWNSLAESMDSQASDVHV